MYPLSPRVKGLPGKEAHIRDGAPLGHHPKKRARTLGPLFQMHPYISTGPQFKKYSPGGQERLTHREHAQQISDRSHLPRRSYSTSTVFLYAGGAREPRSNGLWGVIPGGHGDLEDIFGTGGDRGYHPMKRSKLWALGGAREPPSNAYLGVILGG